MRAERRAFGTELKVLSADYAGFRANIKGFASTVLGQLGVAVPGAALLTALFNSATGIATGLNQFSRAQEMAEAIETAEEIIETLRDQLGEQAWAEMDGVKSQLNAGNLPTYPGGVKFMAQNSTEPGRISVSELSDKELEELKEAAQNMRLVRSDLLYRAVLEMVRDRVNAVDVGQNP
jgi:hypothetical protein